MPVKVTITFKDGTKKVLETKPYGIDEWTRSRNAVSLAVNQLTAEQREKIEDYKLEDDYL